MGDMRLMLRGGITAATTEEGGAKGGSSIDVTPIPATP